jgi:DNA-binding MarR family transcriptional regulator
VISDSGIITGLQRTTHVTLHALGTALADLKLTPAEINALAVLADQRPRSVSELSALTGTRATTLTGVLDRLEHRGYASRGIDPADRRSFLITLTPTGREAAAAVRAAVARLEERALAGLTPEQIAGFHAVIAALEVGDA